MEYEFEMRGNESGWIGVFTDSTESDELKTKTRRADADGLASLRMRTGEPLETVFIDLIAGGQARRFRCVSDENCLLHLKFPECTVSKNGNDIDIGIGEEYEALYLEGAHVDEIQKE